uniref:Uncharacterized protein n=1 Tax=Oryza sativa subsp. japonica TaxID=39947 RepID=Q6YU03_ORYSJ|nr:hypothetical protein [Oryza sativa Japonica Group]BAD17724.1 hypothetical protein [Oryza sativa Japonica Group]
MIVRVGAEAMGSFQKVTKVSLFILDNLMNCVAPKEVHGCTYDMCVLRAVGCGCTGEPVYAQCLRFNKMSIVEHSASRSTKEGGISLPYPMLTSTNDSTWQINMEVQCIWDAIKITADEVMEKKDKAALACLFGPVPDDVLQQIAKKKTMKEAWKSLKTRYLSVDQVKKARVQTLKSQF